MARSAMGQLATRLERRRNRDKDHITERSSRKDVAKLGPISDAIRKVAADKRGSKRVRFDETVHFKLVKETKGALRYQEVDDDGDAKEDNTIGTLYLRKDALVEGSKPPKRLTVTISED